MKIIIGIGNTSRGDDGLGCEFLHCLDKRSFKDWQFIERIQLNIEDVELIKDVELVVFIDSFNGKLDKGFLFEECHSRVDFEYTTHELNPGAILAQSNHQYNKKPLAFVMKVQGFEWGMEKGLSTRASVNLNKAVDYFNRKMSSHQLV